MKIESLRSAKFETLKKHEAAAVLGGGGATTDATFDYIGQTGGEADYVKIDSNPTFEQLDA